MQTVWAKVEPERGQIELYKYKLSGVNCWEKVNGSCASPFDRYHLTGKEMRPYKERASEVICSRTLIARKGGDSLQIGGHTK